VQAPELQRLLSPYSDRALCCMHAELMLYNPLGLARLMHSWVMKLQRRSMYKAKGGRDIEKESSE